MTKHLRMAAKVALTLARPLLFLLTVAAGLFVGRFTLMPTKRPARALHTVVLRDMVRPLVAGFRS